MIATAARALGALVLAQRHGRYVRTVQAISRRRRRKRALLALVGGLEASRKASAAARTRGRRRRVERCRWSESTLQKYLEGDEKTFKKNFRMSKESVELIASELSGGGYLKTNTCRDPRQRITGVFKVAACLYLFAHGTSMKVTGDVAGLGESTVRSYVQAFCLGVMRVLKPKYMPGKAPSAEFLEGIRGQFAARRGVPNVAMAVDGTHVPFRPDEASSHSDWRNYKGWNSILCVSFVNSYYMFVESDVGSAGRSGDNTVLKQCWMMRQIMADREGWLGPEGVIAADGGASDGDGVLLNPYSQPTTPEECWFNFCHSSTRFFVEETFGRWKNRFRFLMKESEETHKMTCQIIYASMILHNLCTVRKDDPEFSEGDNDEWVSFFEKFASHRCPSCVRRNAQHCTHSARNRAGTKQAKGAPSVQRDLVKKMLWERLMEDTSQSKVMQSGEADDLAAMSTLQNEMERRAEEGL